MSQLLEKTEKANLVALDGPLYVSHLHLKNFVTLPSQNHVWNMQLTSKQSNSPVYYFINLRKVIDTICEGIGYENLPFLVGHQERHRTDISTKVSTTFSVCSQLFLGCALLYSFAFKFFEIPLKLSLIYSDLIFRVA